MSEPREVVVVEPLRTVDDDVVEAFARLVPQLSSSSPAPDEAELKTIVTSDGTVIFVARLDGRIVGSLTFVTFRIPTGMKAWIEDVVVDESVRGRGVGELLNRAALGEARRRSIDSVSLTSRPSRDAANRLYQRIGFEPRETNVYRYRL